MEKELTGQRTLLNRSETIALNDFISNRENRSGSLSVSLVNDRTENTSAPVESSTSANAEIEKCMHDNVGVIRGVGTGPGCCKPFTALKKGLVYD